MDNSFIGEIRAFPYNFVPQGWLPCDGRRLPINQNQALFSILGSTFGTYDGANFCIPNLKGLAVVGADLDPFNSDYNLGDVEGCTSCTLTWYELPPHNHIISGDKRITSEASLGTATPTNQTFISNSMATLPNGKTPGLFSYSKTGNKASNNSFVGYAGGGLPHDNMMPYFTLQYCICNDGLYPPRP